MWASANTNTTGKKTKSTSTTILPLEKYLSNTRAEFAQQRAETPKLLEKATIPAFDAE